MTDNQGFMGISHINALGSNKLAAYAAAATSVLKSDGGIFLARGGPQENLKGIENTRNVVGQLPSLKVAYECYHSSDYWVAIKLGKGVFQRSFVINECVE